MHKNKAWLSFLFVITAITVWFSSQAASELFFYFRLNSQTPVEEIHWEVVKIADETFDLSATYSYKIREKIYQGKTTLSSYRNPWAAKEALTIHQKRPWQAWYDAKAPQKSSLERTFPTKQVVSAILMLMLLFYFYWLGLYVGRRYP